jgi:hypothetical protein
MYVLPLFGITDEVNIVILNKVKEFSMVDFDDMKNKAEEENWDDKGRDMAKDKFDRGDNPREHEQQGQQDQDFETEE